ncbi:MAG TPA: hypothetical protein VFP68_13255 [Burkholderiaceae bacterium]|nr:hypothetical protein [Burkholderiaceae bacterium]
MIPLTNFPSTSNTATTSAIQPAARPLQTNQAARPQEGHPGPLENLPRRNAGNQVRANLVRHASNVLAAAGGLAGVGGIVGGALMVRDSIIGMHSTPDDAAPAFGVSPAFARGFVGIGVASIGLTATVAAAVNLLNSRGTHTHSPAASFGATRVPRQTLLDAIDIAMEMDETMNQGDILHIVNHIRDYERGNEVSADVSRAIEVQTDAAQEGAPHIAVTIEDTGSNAHEQTPSATEEPPSAPRQIVENLLQLVSATPPILPRQAGDLNPAR